MLWGYPQISKGAEREELQDPEGIFAGPDTVKNFETLDFFTPIRLYVVEAKFIRTPESILFDAYNYR
jgi:hypothetical protein